MNSQKILYTALVIMTLGLISCRHNPEQHAERIVRRIGSELNLNEDQKLKLEAIKLEIQASRVELKEKRAESLETLIQQVKGKELDPQVLRGLIDQRRAEVDRLSPKVIDKVVAFHATLSDEQKEKVAEKLTKFKAFTTE